MANQLSWPAMLLLGVMLVSGCGYNVKPYYDESIAIKEAYAAELQKIVDVDSARAAVPELEKLSNRHDAWEQSIRGVVMTIEDYERHSDRYEPAHNALLAERDRVIALLEDDRSKIAETIAELCRGPTSQ